MSEKARRRGLRASPAPAMRDIENSLAPSIVKKSLQDVMLSRVSPDPENPRKIYLDYQNPRQIDESSPHVEKARKQLEEAESLALSIKAEGLINAVDVYRVGDNFQLVIGHMRYIAHILNEATTIKANVHNTKPRNIKVLQYLENFHRSDLSFDVRFISLSQALQEEFDTVELAEVESEELLKALTNTLGIARTQAFQWKKVVSDPQVAELVDRGYIASLKAAYDVAQMDAADRGAWIRAHSNDEHTGESKDDEGGGQTHAPKTNAAQTGRVHTYARPLRAVKLKPVKDRSVVKELINRSVGLDKFKDVDWNDYQQATLALERAVKLLTEELSNASQTKSLKA